MSGKPRRPVLRYHGGKWRLAPWVIEHLPPHRVYVEPFGGAASVLMRKERSYAEIYNDLDGEVVNVFEVLRDRAGADELSELLWLTPYARDEFENAYEYDAESSAVERARRTVVKSFMGFGSAAIHDTVPVGMRTRASRWAPPTGFRSNSARSGTTSAHDWAGYPHHLRRFCERLRGVVIENRAALEVIAQHDGPDTLHYVDPPYPISSRCESAATRGKGYAHELTDDEHTTLAETVRSVAGMVVVSGYPCELYDELYPDWKRLERGHMADGASPRTEVLWISPSAEKLELELTWETGAAHARERGEQ